MLPDKPSLASNEGSGFWARCPVYRTGDNATPVAFHSVAPNPTLSSQMHWSQWRTLDSPRYFVPTNTDCAKAIRPLNLLRSISPTQIR